MSTEVLLETNLPGVPLLKRGKVRDIYDLGDCLLIVATDRISAFDCVLPTGIPGKGKILTGLSQFWFEYTADLVPNHLLSTNVADFPPPLLDYAEQLEGRAMLVRKAEVVPVECVVRGYLAGSAWREYRETGSICGLSLPPDLREADQLSEPLFTPATKAATGHDENITFDQVVELAGADLAAELREKSLALYRRAAAYARERGFLIADTKFEFGRVGGELIVVDEMLTPDSSRFWDVNDYQPGRPQEAFDKQFVR
ncbi:MAG TPA: phosphoribosylaminoimidazolesuccinocarboxamide synthase, partial [Armatimonadetes bacterium]|nr:phosphoribosylaminoimidazolesuccinocarboxamide synthase [Armatimonadota bacterium]